MIKKIENTDTYHGSSLYTYQLQSIVQRVCEFTNSFS